MSQPVAKLVSVNVGLPREITWQGRTVFTGIWKEPVDGPRTVRRLNVDGDGQGDLNGHGGEQRAVYVYQLDSYRYWQGEMQRDDFTFGQFGENFTVDGLGDDEVCIGDRYRIGSALFEVTQPRVTCYRVGIRMDEPRMAALLVAHGRPGFYFRVLEEGEVAAGDDVMKIATGPEAMTVADVNALLYLAGRHDVDQLRRALRIPALSPGWQASLQALLDEELAGSAGGGNAGLTAAGTTAGVARLPDAAGRGEAIGEHRRRVAGAGVRRRSAAARRRPGQFITLKLAPGAGSPPLVRSYSLSGRRATTRYRISVKVEPHGAAGHYIRDDRPRRRPVGGRRARGAVHPRRRRSPGRARQRRRRRDADARDVARAPRRAFDPRHLVAARRAEPRRARVRRQRRSRSWTISRTRTVASGTAGPDPTDHAGDRLRRDAGASQPEALAGDRRPDRRRVLPVRTDRVHGRVARRPRRARRSSGRVHTEIFGAQGSITPGVVAAPARPPHQPEGAPGTGPLDLVRRGPG